MASKARRRGWKEDDDISEQSTKYERQLQSEQKGQRKLKTSKGWCICAVLAAVLLFGAAVLVCLPCPIEPVAFILPPPPEWVGHLAPNNRLSEADRLFENKLTGPESIVSDGEFLYTGVSDGRVLSINRGEIHTLATFGKGIDCGSFDSEPECGRPLGMRLDKDGYLLVADAYLGIYRVNVATGDFQQLLSSQQPTGDHAFQFLNDIEQGPDGLIYFTDSSTRWDRRHNRYCILEGEASGRLLSYDPDSHHVDELLGGLAFANGVAVSYDKTHILVAETGRARIWRYYISGPKKGESDIFADNLPGLPDNVRRSGRGTYWVGMATIRRAGKLSLVDVLSQWPWVRRLIVKLISQETIMRLVPSYGLVVELGKEGGIVSSLHDPAGARLPSTSEIEEKNGVLYIGSYSLPFLSRVYLSRK